MADGMNGRLAGKVALIVGAARGIGAGIAERFHEEGAQVVIADTEAEAGAATAERLKGKFVATDISKPADAERAVAGYARGLWRSSHRGAERRHLSVVADRKHLAGRVGHGPRRQPAGRVPDRPRRIAAHEGETLRAVRVHLLDHRPARHQSGPRSLFRVQGRHQRLHQIGGAGILRPTTSRSTASSRATS